MRKLERVDGAIGAPKTGRLPAAKMRIARLMNDIASEFACTKECGWVDVLSTSEKTGSTKRREEKKVCGGNETKSEGKKGKVAVEVEVEVTVINRLATFTVGSLAPQFCLRSNLNLESGDLLIARQ